MRPSVLRTRFATGICGATLLALALPLPGSHTVPSAQAKPAAIERQVVLEGDRVYVHNLVGVLHIVEGEGTSVIAEVAPRGRDADRLRIEDEDRHGAASLRIIYPSRKIRVPGYMGRSTFRVRSDGSLDGDTNEGERVELSGREGDLEASADVTLRVPPGKKLNVYWGHGTGDVGEVASYVSIDGASMDVGASNMRGPLQVSVGSGSVRVSRSDGEVHVETGSGDVDVSDVAASDLSVETGSGTIRVSRIRCPTLSLETGSGDIEARAIRSPHTSLETGSGNVELALEGNVEAVSVESGSGNLSVAVPDDFGADVHLETGSGSIETSAPMRVTRRSRHELRGTIGDGSGRLSLETGSGRVELVGAAR